MLPACISVALWHHLSRHSRGVKAWEEAAQAKASDVESFDLGRKGEGGREGWREGGREGGMERGREMDVVCILF